MSLQNTPVILSNARFTVYSPGCVRLEYSWGGRFSPWPSLLTGPEMARPVAADVVVKGKSLTITTSALELQYTDDGRVFSPENLRIIHKNYRDERVVWTPGKKDEGNLGAVPRSLDQWKWCGGPCHHPVEGVLSTDGGHFIADEPRVYWNGEYDWPQSMGNRVAFDGYFFAYGKEYKAALKDFINVFGSIPMVPKWTFGFWYSRWHDYKDSEIVELVQRYRKEGVPFDVMIIDTDWRKGWGGYDWNTRSFPNPRRLMKQLHKMNVRVSLNDHPGYDDYDSLPDDDSHIPAIAKRLGALPHKGAWACDWSRKDCVEAWCDIVLGPLFDQGMDFWWVDGWIKSPFSNSDSQLWANRIYYGLSRKKTGKRGMILSRWGGVGSHRYPVQFSGDTFSDWNTLQHQIEFTVRSANLCAVYWSNDIGGFMGNKIDDELFIRWSQFGSVCPVFRTHSSHGIREPWLYSRKAQAAFRKQTRMRYSLAPYFYNLAREAHETGLPILRPLYLEYNDNDGGALWRRHQFLVGRDILAIPADGAADKSTKLFRKRAYFPNAVWYGLETDEVVTGMKDCHIDIPVERIPLYARAGAIIPSQPVGQYLGTRTSEELHFDYFPNQFDDSRYSLYEDDGETMDFEKGAFARTDVRGRCRGNVVEFDIGAPEGVYKGMPKKRKYCIRALLDKDVKSVSVKVRVGSGSWKPARAKVVKKCLAVGIKSGHSFAETIVSSRNQPVSVRFELV